MNGIGVILSSVNFVFCLLLLWHAVRTRLASAIVWFMSAYFAWFFVLMGSNGPYSRVRGFTAEVISVRQGTIDLLSGYALLFNFLFAISFFLIWALIRTRSIEQSSSWQEGETSPRVGIMSWMFFAFLLAGSALYWLKMRNIGYRGYVEFQFQGSNWPLVFFWASSPFACYMAQKRRYFLAFLGIIPFLFFAWHLNVRSFALLSLIPVTLIFFYQRVAGDGTFSRNSLGIFVRGLPIIFVLIATSVVVTYNKQSRLSGVPDEGKFTGLPDAGLVYGAGLVFESVLHNHMRLEFNSLNRYLVNVAGPFLKIAEKTLGVEIKPVDDTPVYMARLIDGVPKDYPVYHHYPVLWYSDAFISFGMAGLGLAILWGGLAAVFERLMRIGPIALGLMLPFYCWHMYMLIRGAIAVAAAPLTYSFYVALAVVLVLGRVGVRHQNIVEKRNMSRVWSNLLE